MRFPIILLVLAFFFTTVIALIPRQNPFTELAFKNHLSLPQNIFLNKTYSFSFEVKNKENKKMAYSFQALILYNNHSKKIQQGAFILEKKQKTSFKINYSIQEHFNRAKILVKLRKITSSNTPLNYQKNLEIYFWVDEIVPIQVRKI